MRQCFSPICNTSNTDRRGRPREPKFLLEVSLSLKKISFKILHGYESQQENFAIDHKWVQNFRKTSHKWKRIYFARLVTFHVESLKLNASRASLVSSKKTYRWQRGKHNICTHLRSVRNKFIKFTDSTWLINVLRLSRKSCRLKRRRKKKTSFKA